MVSGARATTAGGSKGSVCTAGGTPVQVNTGPVRGVRSQYGSVDRASAATVTWNSSVRVGSSRKNRAIGLPPLAGSGGGAGAAVHPSGTTIVLAPAVTGDPSAWNTLTFTFSVSPADATSRSASASTTVPDARTSASSNWATLIASRKSASAFAPAVADTAAAAVRAARAAARPRARTGTSFAGARTMSALGSDCAAAASIAASSVASAPFGKPARTARPGSDVSIPSNTP